MTKKSMNEPSLSVSSFGPISAATLRFGDLTLLVGPQATGKSLFLQTLKLVIDGQPIASALKRYGFDWQGNPEEFLTSYFGEGVGEAWDSTTTRADWGGKPFDPKKAIGPGKPREERVFYIPAQRVLMLSTDWPRDFMSYGISDPFVLRSYSERVRLLMESGLGRGKGAIFPQLGRLKQEERKLLSTNVFSGGKLIVSRTGGRRRVMLQFGDRRLPPVVWSAGQREFVPLLLGLYHLLPSAKISRREQYHWVIIEEPEMGLHPAAVSSVMMLVFDLISRGYRVVLSTHSSHILSMTWAIRTLVERQTTTKRILTALDYPSTQGMLQIGQAVQAARLKTYYFERHKEGTRTVDISELDPGSEDERMSGWGGVTAYSDDLVDRVADIVAESDD